MIKLKDAHSEMEKTDARGRARPFSIVFCTADLTRDKGGEIIQYDKAILSRMRYERGKTKAVFTASKRANLPSRKRSNTINICCVGSSEITKVHTDLILSINGQDVV